MRSYHINNRQVGGRPVTTMSRGAMVGEMSRSRMGVSTYKEKENLYDENIQLKLFNNGLKEENQRLKMNKL